MAEPKQRKKRKKPEPPKPNQVLCTRRAAVEMLDTSVDTIKALERQGLLTRVRLTGPLSDVHLRVDELLALANGEATTDA